MFSYSNLSYIVFVPDFIISTNSFSGTFLNIFYPLVALEVVSNELLYICLSKPTCLLSYSCNFKFYYSIFLSSHCNRLTFYSSLRVFPVTPLFNVLDLSSVYLTSTLFSFIYSCSWYFSLSLSVSFCYTALYFSSKMSLSYCNLFILPLKPSIICISFYLCLSIAAIHLSLCLVSFLFEDRMLPGSGNPKDIIWYLIFSKASSS